MKLFGTCLVAIAAHSAFGAVSFFNSTSFAGNAAMRSTWLSAIGIGGGANFVDFEGYAVGTELNGVTLGGGAVISHPLSSATVQSAPSFFGGSNPIGSNALAMAESSSPIVLSFVAPVDYVGGYDIDMPGGSVRVTLEDNTFQTFSWDTTGSSGDTAEFWGVWRNDAAAISMVEFLSTNGGDGEWGLDNLEYGAVPEPATVAALGLGLAGFLRSRRKRTSDGRLSMP